MWKLLEIFHVFFIYTVFISIYLIILIFLSVHMSFGLFISFDLFFMFLFLFVKRFLKEVGRFNVLTQEWWLLQTISSVSVNHWDIVEIYNTHWPGHPVSIPEPTKGCLPCCICCASWCCSAFLSRSAMTAVINWLTFCQRCCHCAKLSLEL